MRKALGRPLSRLLFALPILLASVWTAGCATPSGQTVDPFRLREAAARGDAATRASMRLVDEGLRADAAGRPASALAYYERSLQVDPSNPWPYLALARHALDAGRTARALGFLDKASAALGEERDDPRVRVHLTGLRGAAEGDPALRDEAAALAPLVWGDGRLSAEELR